MNFQVHLGVHQAAVFFQGLLQRSQIGWVVFSCQRIERCCDGLVGGFTQGLSLRWIHFCWTGFRCFCELRR